MGLKSRWGLRADGAEQMGLKRWGLRADGA